MSRADTADFLGATSDRDQVSLVSAPSDRAKRTPVNSRRSTLVALAEVYGTTVPELVAEIFATAPPQGDPARSSH